VRVVVDGCERRPDVDRQLPPRCIPPREDQRLSAVGFLNGPDDAGQALHFGNCEVVDEQLLLHAEVDCRLGVGRACGGAQEHACAQPSKHWEGEAPAEPQYRLDARCGSARQERRPRGRFTASTGLSIEHDAAGLNASGTVGRERLRSNPIAGRRSSGQRRSRRAIPACPRATSAADFPLLLRAATSAPCRSSHSTGSSFPWRAKYISSVPPDWSRASTSAP
jgi:hypothetical protein